jgi:hypothetical protein
VSKDFYNDVYQADHPSKYGGGEDGMVLNIRKLLLRL